ncbi:MAG: small multidrug resistance family (SMR) protein, partial [uncultured Thermomicrobiales bacterium]
GLDCPDRVRDARSGVGDGPRQVGGVQPARAVHHLCGGADREHGRARLRDARAADRDILRGLGGDRGGADHGLRDGVRRRANLARQGAVAAGDRGLRRRAQGAAL